MVWLGGITIALGGVFLVKYSIDLGLLSPAVRISLGTLLGIALTVVGEWLRRRPLQRASASVGPDHVPPALTSAGILVAFGSIYAGHVLYGLLSPMAAFGFLAAIAFGALALSILQGALVAIMGIAGAFTIPLLIETDAPSAWGLLTYLLFVAAAAFAVVRYTGWWWLAWTALAGSFFWEILWFGRMWEPADLPAITTHMLALFAMAAAVRWEDLFGKSHATGHPFDLAAKSEPARLVIGAAVCLTISAFILVRMDGYGIGALVTAGLMATILIASALRIRDMEILLPLVAFASLALLAAWHQPVLMQARHNIVSDGDVIATLNVPVLPPEFALFSAVALIIAAGFGAAGYLGLRRSRLPGLWAGISAAVPLSALIIAYWRMDAHAPDMAWGGIAMALAILATAAASRVVRHREQPGMDTALGLYVLAVIAAISLAAAMTLEKTWLSIALAVQLPATAWVHNRLHIAFLRPAAAAIALAVGLRLVLLHHLPGTPLQVQLDAFWILYSYGLPALMFAIAARWFRRTADDRLVTILESGTIAITVALISMEIRHFAGDGTLGYRSYGLLEQSLHSISWLATGFGLYVRHRFSARPIDLSAAQILMGLAGLQVFGLQVLLSNPLLSGEDVGAWPLVNLLFLAYVVPALFALAIHFEAQRRRERLPANLAAAAFFVLLFVYGTLEVRHLFHGSVLTAGAMTNAEGYAYSVLWLVYAGALLAAGMARRIAMLRYASLGLVLMVVAKVFLWDMSWLTGLYRVASFLGLGFSLVAIGYFYQRFVLRPGADKAESSAGPDPASSEPPDTPVDDR